jgi:GTPase SAR1 family protein
MSTLSTIAKPTNRPPIITICGDAGTGKTTLAATFPKPIVIRAEDGLQAIPEASRPDAFPILKSASDLWAQLTDLIKEPHEYQTLIIDSVTALERLFIQDVIDGDPKKPKGINQALGGYGNGVAAVAAMHQRVRKAAGALNERKNMNIIFVAHADLENMDLPDQEAYSRYSLRLGKKSIAPYTDDSDLVGFLKLNSFVKGGEGEKNKVVSTGQRLLTTYSIASSVSKNRYGITQDLTVEQGVNPLIDFIPTLKAGK